MNSSPRHLHKSSHTTILSLYNALTPYEPEKGEMQMNRLDQPTRITS